MDGSAKTIECRCRDGSLQTRQVIQTLHKQSNPYIVSLLHMVLMFPGFS